MTVQFDVPGEKRKLLAQALAGTLNLPAVYQGTPTFSYTIGSLTLTRDGKLIFPDTTQREVVEQIVGGMVGEGFVPLASDESLLAISVPHHLMDEAALQRLEQVIASKSILFQRAFQTDSLKLEKDDKEIRFPWFKLTGEEGESEAYSNFVTKLWQYAAKRKRIIAKPYVGENDKFTMRLFLVQLGLKGPEFKETRRILLQNLSGNSAWKSGHAPEQKSPCSPTAAIPTDSERTDRYSREDMEVKK